MLHDNLQIAQNGHLCFAGFDTVELARTYGTPLYLLDEARIRRNCRLYTEALTTALGPSARPFYASKALCFTGLYPILQSEGMGADVVSGGELYTALRGGFPAADICFHGSNKTDEEIAYALEQGVGCFIVDNAEELTVLSALAQQAGKTQDILLRVTPGIDPHTFEAVNTGKIDCQFGVPIETGQALRFAGEALRTPGVRLRGFHCHIGSQIFDWFPFRDAANRMLDFLCEVRSLYGFTAEVLDLGGGFGVRYVESDPVMDIPAVIETLGRHLRMRCEERAYPLPAVWMEPGRSIVADAGLTLYSVGGVKTIDGYRSYVSVDGGMTDNPRYALYRSAYTILHAERPAASADFLCTVAGRCCESGALIQEHVYLPRPARGELLAVTVTGAYNYAMASNYNRVARPPIVLLGADGPRVVVRRESFADECACDVI